MPCVLRRPTRIALLVLLVLLAGAGVACAKACVWDGVKRIVAVGDVHGDFGRLVELLQAAHLLGPGKEWIAGTAHLVQLGDVLDRGPHSKRVLDLLMRLEKDGAKAGGAVHALIGNHEVRVMRGILRDTHPGEIESFGDRNGLLKAMAPKGVYGSWIRSHNTVIRINEFLFVHGGIAPRYCNMSLEEINTRVRLALAGKNEDGGAILEDRESPLYYRGYARRSERKLLREIRNVQQAYGVRSVVVGHSVSQEGIRMRAGGGVILVDVGFSRTYLNREPACLLIHGNHLAVVTPRGILPLEHPGASRTFQEALSGGRAPGR